MPLRVSPAKIACLDFNLQKTKMQMGVQVLVTDPRELEKIRQRLVHLSYTISSLKNHIGGTCIDGECNFCLAERLT